MRNAEVARKQIIKEDLNQEEFKSLVKLLLRKKQSYGYRNKLKYILYIPYSVLLNLNKIIRSYLPTPPLGQDMTQGQFFLSGV